MELDFRLIEWVSYVTGGRRGSLESEGLNAGLLQS